MVFSQPQRRNPFEPSVTMSSCLRRGQKVPQRRGRDGLTKRVCQCPPASGCALPASLCSVLCTSKSAAVMQTLLYVPPALPLLTFQGFARGWHRLQKPKVTDHKPHFSPPLQGRLDMHSAWREFAAGVAGSSDLRERIHRRAASAGARRQAQLIIKPPHLTTNIGRAQVRSRRCPGRGFHVPSGFPLPVRAASRRTNEHAPATCRASHATHLRSKRPPECTCCRGLTRYLLDTLTAGDPAPPPRPPPLVFANWRVYTFSDVSHSPLEAHRRVISPPFPPFAQPSL